MLVVLMFQCRTEGGVGDKAAVRFYGASAIFGVWAGYACMETFRFYLQRAIRALSLRSERLRKRLLALECITGELEEARKRSLMIAQRRVKKTRFRSEPVYERDMDSDRATTGSAVEEDAIELTPQDRVG